MKDDFRFAAYDEELRSYIVQFHERPDPALVVPILTRIIRHYLPKDSTVTVDAALQDSIAELGLDSLTMMEITLDVQDAFGAVFNEEELRGLKSFSEITSLIDQKIRKLTSGEA